MIVESVTMIAERDPVTTAAIEIGIETGTGTGTVTGIGMVSESGNETVAAAVGVLAHLEVITIIPEARLGETMN